MKKITLGFVVLLSCMSVLTYAAPSQDVSEEQTAPAAVPAGQYNEAPMLAERVARGELPPVDERLPNNPLVLTQERNMAPDGSLDYEIGTYGGTLRTIHLQPRGTFVVSAMAKETLLNRPGYNLADPLTPHLMEDFSVNADNTVFTFRIREGMKWSDGVPVTTEDVQFYYEDFFLNKDVIPNVWMDLRSGTTPLGEPLTIEIDDQYTYRIIFSEPTPQFLDLNNKPWSSVRKFPLLPKHHLTQFHPNYISEQELMNQIKAVGLANREDWVKMFHARTHRENWDIPSVIGSPVIHPWILTEATPTTIVKERNPYYWKVDTAGNQLPYIDRIVSTKVEDAEAANLKIIAGEVDLDDMLPAINSLPLYLEHADRAGYQVAPMALPFNRISIYMNFAHEDPVWNEVTDDVRFRRAVTYAIDSEDIRQSVYYGFGELPQWVPGEYDPDKANALLDEAGLDERDSDGWRLGPDGNRFDVPFEIHARYPDRVPVTELVVDHLRAVGLHASFKVIDLSLYDQRLEANQPKITVDSDENVTLYAFGHAKRFLHGRFSSYRSWVDTGGVEGTRPHDWWLELLDLGLKMGPGLAWDEDVYQEFRSKFYDYIPLIHILHNPPQPVIINSKLGNIFTEGVSQWLTYSGEQLFFRE